MNLRRHGDSGNEDNVHAKQKFAMPQHIMQIMFSIGQFKKLISWRHLSNKRIGSPIYYLFAFILLLYFVVYWRKTSYQRSILDLSSMWIKILHIQLIAINDICVFKRIILKTDPKCIIHEILFLINSIHSLYDQTFQKITS